MLRIAVCDDVSEYRQELTGCIKSWSEKRDIPVRVAQFASGEEVLFALESEGDFDAVFMDASLGGMNGMETASGSGGVILRQASCSSLSMSGI